MIKNLLIDFPFYNEKHYKKITETIDPIDKLYGWYVKRGDLFQLGPVCGSKVRQCLHVVHENLNLIRENYNNGLVTGAGLPSPQTPIVSAVAKYFGMKCAITTPKYDNSKRDYFRINASLSQKLGAKVYGYDHPQPPVLKRDVIELEKQLKYFHIKFGMLGHVVMEPIIYQCQNIPDFIKDIVVISGSGITALSIMSGIAIHNKNVDSIRIIKLSNYFNKNKEVLYDPLPTREKFMGDVYQIDSDIPYRTEYKWNKGFDFDLTYESKAFKWMTESRLKPHSTLFWIIGRREYDLDLIEPIKWHMSNHAKSLRNPKATMEIFLK